MFEVALNVISVVVQGAGTRHSLRVLRRHKHLVQHADPLHMCLADKAPALLDAPNNDQTDIQYAA